MRNWKAARIASKIETAEAAEADHHELLQVLREATNDEDDLWSVASCLVPYVSIMTAVADRAHELGASRERALGYLAAAYLFDHDDLAGAVALLKARATEATDPVFLDSWAHCAEAPLATIDRLRTAATRVEKPLPFLEKALNYATKEGLHELADELREDIKQLR